MLQIADFGLLSAFRRGSLVTSVKPFDAMPNRTLRIVVVEDNYDANAALSKLLEKSGFELVGRAYDGNAGFILIRETKPDVAILDIAMPALDGFGLARRVRSEIGSRPWLVALTGFGMASEKAEAASAGIDAYFCKPADWPALESLLLNYADRAADELAARIATCRSLESHGASSGHGSPIS
jgi:DNA-binding response OmpR family regulator